MAGERVDHLKCVRAGWLGACRGGEEEREGRGDWGVHVVPLERERGDEQPVRLRAGKGSCGCQEASGSFENDGGCAASPRRGACESGRIGWLHHDFLTYK